MEKLNKRQILLEISEDKKSIKVAIGQFPEIEFSTCPNKVIESCQGVIQSYFDKTGIHCCLKEWTDEKCSCYDFNCRC